MQSPHAVLSKADVMTPTGRKHPLVASPMRSSRNLHRKSASPPRNRSRGRTVALQRRDLRCGPPTSCRAGGGSPAAAWRTACPAEGAERACLLDLFRCLTPQPVLLAPNRHSQTIQGSYFVPSSSLASSLIDKSHLTIKMAQTQGEWIISLSKRALWLLLRPSALPGAVMRPPCEGGECPVCLNS